MNFLKELKSLADKAVQFINDRLSQETKITFFEKSLEDDEDWDRDIYDDIPDFEFYGFSSSAEWAAFKEIRKTLDNRIEIDGILKGDSYPKQITVVLDELSAQAILDLADYLNKLERQS